MTFLILSPVQGAIGSMMPTPCTAGQVWSYISSSLYGSLIGFSKHCDGNQNMGASKLPRYLEAAEWDLKPFWPGKELERC